MAGRRRVSRRVFQSVRWLTRGIGCLLALAVCAFLFLRLRGVPQPILRALVKRANEAGLPIDIGHACLTLRGWRATDVRFYGPSPDDLDPILSADEVLLARDSQLRSAPSGERFFDVEATGVRVNPSVRWGLQLPPDAAARRVARVRFAARVGPDEARVERGRLRWLGADISIEGRANLATLRGKTLKKTWPTWFSAERFEAWASHLNNLSFTAPPQIDLRVEIGAGLLADSRAEVTASVGDFAFLGVGFDSFRGGARYEGRKLWVDRMELTRGVETLSVEGEYDPRSNLLRGGLRNGFTSKELLLLAPRWAVDALASSGVRFSELPRLELEVGPVRPDGALGALKGSFSIRELAYRGLELESLKGAFARLGTRLELTKLRGVARGQQARADMVGSAMRGGEATGEAYWDARTHTFGAKAAGRLDPNLLTGPLAPVRPAINAISRFKFHAAPPEFEVELGGCLTNWPGFFLRIQAMADDVRIHDAELSSLNASAFYQNGVLELGPVAAMKGVDFLKGSGAVLFRARAAEFDAFGSMPLEVIEAAVCPGAELFRHHLKVAGETRVTARGRVEWATMRTTDFSAEVQAERVGLPFVELRDFSAEVICRGPVLEVRGAEFGVLGGAAEGNFQVVVDPATNALPCEVGARVADVDFQQLHELFTKKPSGAQGRVGGRFQAAFDLTLDFFRTARGAGSVEVEKGDLADLPFFSGFSRLVRKVVPGFKVFSITKFKGDFTLDRGVVRSDNAYFEGDVLSAKARGKYVPKRGLDARVEAQILRDNHVSRVFRLITSPLFKLFEMRLTGPLADPQWRLDHFSSDDAGVEAGE